MKRRIFIAITLPDDVKKQLALYQEKIDNLFEAPSPVRWTKKDNLHITLMFLGYLTEDELMDVCRITQEVASRHQAFSINLKKILYGPPGKPPRMIWVEGEKSAELGALQKDLENSFVVSTTQDPEEKGRPYAPHITLGRIKMWEFRQQDPETRPEVEENINLSFDVSAVEIMESKLKRVGPDYNILQSCAFTSSASEE